MEATGGTIQLTGPGAQTSSVVLQPPLDTVSSSEINREGATKGANLMRNIQNQKILTTDLPNHQNQ